MTPDEILNQLETPTPTVPCLACGRELEPVDAEAENQPYEGVVCKTWGQYGSTEYDSMDGHFLEFNICDPCLRAAGERGHVLWGRDRAPATVDGSVVGSVELRHPYKLVRWTPDPRPVDPETAPKPGELRVATLDGEQARLVLVVAADDEYPYSTVWLVSNETECAAAWDVRLDPEDTGAAYPLIVETDVSAPVWNAQLGEPLGRLAAGFHDLLEYQLQRPPQKLHPGRRGIPCVSRHDGRWRWKQRELAELHRLAGDCCCFLVDGTPSRIYTAEEWPVHPQTLTLGWTGITPAPHLRRRSATLETFE